MLRTVIGLVAVMTATAGAASVQIRRAEVRPAVVPPGASFDLEVEYIASDPATAGAKVPLQFSYSIAESGNVLYSAPAAAIEAPNGAAAVRVQPLMAAGKRGAYVITVSLRSGSSAVEQAVNLTVGEPAAQPTRAAPAPAAPPAPVAANFVTPAPGSAPAAAPAPPPRAIGTSRAGFAIAYVKSDRKWRLGLRSEPYDKISEHFQEQLVASLQEAGMRRVAAITGGCCIIQLELLQVTSRPAAIKKPGVDVSANVMVTDAANRMVYSRGYRGESKTLMNTWGHLINHAVDAMVNNIMTDQNLLQALAGVR